MAMRDKIEHAIQNQPCTVKDLKSKFGGDRGSDRKVMEAVDQLVHEAVICQRQGVFFTVRSGRADKALLCKVVKLGKNFAFVMLEDGTSDIFIPGRFTRGAMPGDKVLVEKFEHPRVEGSDEGEILAVLEEKNDLVGTVRRVDGMLKFVPDDCPAISMRMMRDCEGGAKDGDKVAVEILQRGNRQEDHRVGVAMRFGSSDEAKRCAKALLYAQDIRSRFPDKVREEAKKLENAEVTEADCEGRMDLRALPIFTIDSAETKDIDDAISLTKTPEGGFELGVHIADVSHYVKPGSELDNEAFHRATSVYYADQVVPMLPKQLSNGICSLNEGVLRLAFSCLMRLDQDGNLTDSQGRRADFSNTIILLTSNLGARCLSGQTSPLGFGAAAAETQRRGQQAIQEAKEFFRPELMGRLDETVLFDPLGPEQLAGIADRLLVELEQRAARQGYTLHHTPAAAKVLAGDKVPPYGARELRRTVSRAVEQALADRIAAGTAHPGTVYTADVDADGHIILTEDTLAACV